MKTKQDSTTTNTSDINQSDLAEFYTKLSDQEVIIYYKGPFDDTILAEIASRIQQKVIEDPKNGNRLFAVFMELAQNISIYSAEKNHLNQTGKWGVGTMAVYERVDKYILTSGNMVDNEVLIPLINKCNKINELDREGLRAMKREYRSTQNSPEHKGGNIGLIQVALKSDLPLRIETKKLNSDYSFFTISVSISKLDNPNS